MHRFFINNDSIEGESVRISGSDFKHISNSLRLQEGDQFIACPGDGRDLLVRITGFNDEHVIGRIIKEEKNTTEPDIRVTLAQAIPKKRNMELVVQKCTEIGISRIIPLTTGRTIVKLSGKKKQKRIKRWQKIATAAAKQSQRGIIPEITDIHNLKKIVDIKEQFDLILLFWADEKQQILQDILARTGKDDISEILMIVGPEGGFSGDEVELIIEEAEGYSLSLGPRILRTETAGLAGLSVILYEFGDLGG